MRSLKALAIVAFASFFAIFANAFGATLRISKIDLGEPFYRSISHLNLVSSRSESGNVTVKFLDRNRRVLQAESGLKIKRSDWETCPLGFCIQNLYELPLPLEKYSCFIEFDFVSPSGTLIFNSRENWGDCVSVPAIPGEKFLPDFTFPNDAYLSEEGSIEIKNVGSSHSELPLTVWGFLKDREGGFIWAGRYQGNVIIQPQGKLLLSFGESLKTWHKKLACSGLFFIDPDAATFERSKLNNLVEVEFGECEEVPSVSNGDRIDFRPLANIESGILSLHAQNQGRLPFVEDTAHLETNVRYLGPNRELLFKKTIFTDPSIYGFGDSKEILQDTFPAETCFVEIEVNPNLTIKESDYLNNRIGLKICE